MLASRLQTQSKLRGYRMTRIAIIDRADMNAEQARVYDAAKQTSGIVGGPYHAYIRLPKVFEASQHMRAALASGPLSRREQQIVNLAVARHWNARYPWFAQVRNSLSVGIEQAVIDAINAPGRCARAHVLCRGARAPRRQGAERRELRRRGKDDGAGAPGRAGRDGRQLFDDVSHRRHVPDRSAA
jgi:hypothetical protein